MYSISNNWFTNSNNTAGYIYILRDPRDIAISWAKHASLSYDASIEFMLNGEACIEWAQTKSELPPKLLKAAALIAYHQPMPQSRLVELLGQRAYDHIRELAQAGLIGRRRDGNTRRLTTTRRFSEMFGCPHTDRKKVKAWFRDMVMSSGMLDGMESKLALRDESEEGGVQMTLDVSEDE